MKRYWRIVEKEAAKRAALTDEAADFDDLVVAGAEGLWEAIERYDPRRKVQFLTFAYPRIRGAVVDAVRRLSRFTRTHYEAARVTADEAGEFIADALPRIDRLNDPVADEERPLVDLLADRLAEQPDVGVRTDEWWTSLLKSLNAIERRVMTLYFRSGLTMAWIGETVGLSESRVSQMIKRALERLRSITPQALKEGPL